MYISPRVRTVLEVVLLHLNCSISAVRVILVVVLVVEFKSKIKAVVRLCVFIYLSVYQQKYRDRRTNKQQAEWFRVCFVELKLVHSFIHEKLVKNKCGAVSQLLSYLLLRQSTRFNENKTNVKAISISAHCSSQKQNDVVVTGFACGCVTTRIRSMSFIQSFVLLGHFLIKCPLFIIIIIIIILIMYICIYNEFQIRQY